MPETKSIQTFTYDELSDEQTKGLPSNVIPGPSPKGRAHAWLEELVEAFLVDDIDTLLQAELEQRGLSGLHNDQSPSWSFDYSHVPYVAFAGTIDLEKITPIQGDEGDGDQAADEQHIAAIKLAMADIPPDDFTVNVAGTDWQGRQLTEGTDVTCYFDFDGTDKDEDQIVTGVREAVIAWLDDLSQRFLRMGNAELEHLYSEENLRETCAANGYLFDATGRPVHHLLEREDA